jgi:hypothetical protein
VEILAAEAEALDAPLWPSSAGFFLQPTLATASTIEHPETSETMRMSTLLRR